MTEPVTGADFLAVPEFIRIIDTLKDEKHNATITLVNGTVVTDLLVTDYDGNYVQVSGDPDNNAYRWVGIAKIVDTGP